MPSKTPEQKSTKRIYKKDYIFAVGRRKEAVARVRLYSSSSNMQINGKDLSKGDIIVNGKPIAAYFSFFSYTPTFKQFNEFTDNGLSKFITSIKVEGGGLKGQIDAVIHGLARVLDKVDHEKYHKLLRDKGYLTRDARTRERRKVGTGGKARRQKQSPKR